MTLLAGQGGVRLLVLDAQGGADCGLWRRASSKMAFYAQRSCAVHPPGCRHVYAHLKRELAQHAGMVEKYIIMHDTVVDGKGACVWGAPGAHSCAGSARSGAAASCDTCFFLPSPSSPPTPLRGREHPQR